MIQYFCQYGNMFIQGDFVMKLDTACIHAIKDETYATKAVAVPIYQSATFAHPSVSQSTGYDYSRSGNPTREYAERLLACLGGGVAALAFSTGMATIPTPMELFLLETKLSRLKICMAAANQARDQRQVSALISRNRGRGRHPLKI